MTKFSMLKISCLDFRFRILFATAFGGVPRGRENLTFELWI
jgi:hypothetical protein